MEPTARNVSTDMRPWKGRTAMDNPLADGLGGIRGTPTVGLRPRLLTFHPSADGAG